MFDTPSVFLYLNLLKSQTKNFHSSISSSPFQSASIDSIHNWLFLAARQYKIDELNLFCEFANICNLQCSWLCVNIIIRENTLSAANKLLTMTNVRNNFFLLWIDKTCKNPLPDRLSRAISGKKQLLFSIFSHTALQAIDFFWVFMTSNIYNQPVVGTCKEAET